MLVFPFPLMMWNRHSRPLNFCLLSSGTDRWEYPVEKDVSTVLWLWDPLWFCSFTWWHFTFLNLEAVPCRKSAVYFWNLTNSYPSLVLFQLLRLVYPRRPCFSLRGQGRLGPEPHSCFLLLERHAAVGRGGWDSCFSYLNKRVPQNRSEGVSFGLSKPALVSPMDMCLNLECLTQNCSFL